MEGSPWPYVGLGATPSLQGDLGAPEGVRADVPSCEEREFKYGFLPRGDYSQVGFNVLRGKRKGPMAWGLRGVQKRASSPVR